MLLKFDDYNVNEINKRLAVYYGKEIDGLPKFRVVWAEKRTEVRFGTFSEWYGSIIIREVENVVQETRKYAYLKGCWILEKRVYFPTNPYPDVLADVILPEKKVTNGWYECAWAFLDKKGNYLPPWWPAIEYFLHMLLYGTHPRILNWDSEEHGEENKEIEKFVDILADAGSAMDGAFVHGDAVSYANLDAKRLLQRR